MKAQGLDVISFAAGEPDFNTPGPVCEAAIEALNRGLTKYLPTAGYGPLREAIAEKLRTEHGIPLEPGQIVVSSGAKQSLFNAMLALLDPGDEIVLLRPFWMTYRDQALLIGASPRAVPCLAENGFRPRMEDLEAVVGPRTRAILINSPCNPTGAVFSKDLIQQIAEFALRHRLWIITDEIYESLAYGDRPVSIASLSEEVRAQTVTIGGFSKTYSMTGWRLGYSAAPPKIANSITCIQDQITSNATSFAQAGALAALTMPKSVVEGMRDTFLLRRNLMYSRMQQIPGLQLGAPPEGAFYLFPSIGQLLKERFPTDAALSECLLEKGRIATVPGSVFEGTGHIRFSYAACEEDIERGMDRLSRTLSELSG